MKAMRLKTTKNCFIPVLINRLLLFVYTLDAPQAQNVSKFIKKNLFSAFFLFRRQATHREIEIGVGERFMIEAEVPPLVIKREEAVP